MPGTRLTGVWKTNITPLFRLFAGGGLPLPQEQLVLPGLPGTPESRPPCETDPSPDHPHGCEERINNVERVARYGNDLLVHGLASDVPAVVSIAVTLGMSVSQRTLDIVNAGNTATGFVAMFADAREIVGTVLNRKATRRDLAVDVGHLIFGDILSTAASTIPLWTPVSLAHPIALSVFVGGQLLGIALDGCKFAYDRKRKGQQSAFW